MNLAAPHVGFVLAAYAIAFVVITGMILATILDYRGLKKKLQQAAARASRGRDHAH
jgi:heme exporter protein CcmD